MVKVIDDFETKQLDEIQEELKTDDWHLDKMHDIILNSLEAEDLITKKLRLASTERKITRWDRLADKVANFWWSRSFIMIFGGLMIVWMSVNIYLAFFDAAFDPYPFILLNLMLSTIAALQAPIIMMSQNRKETKDRKRAENDYMVNLKSEIGIKMLNEKIDLLIIEKMTKLFDMQKEQLTYLKKILPDMPEASQS